MHGDNSTVHPLLRGTTGEQLIGTAYIDEATDRILSAHSQELWKLERQQTFQEPDNPSWRASADGDWPLSLRLMDEGRPAVKSYFRGFAERSLVSRRVRVVEFPISPYLQWELTSLRIQCEYGADVRVVTADQVRRFEEHSTLPELLTIGPGVVYEVIYDTDGLFHSANRFTDPGVVARCHAFTASLYGVGDDLTSFVDREVAPLPAPVATQSVGGDS